MINLISSTGLDKDTLVEKIISQFLTMESLHYARSLLEVFDDQHHFIGDNLFETTFWLRQDQAPLIFEVSGPFDIISKQYATIGKIYQRGELEFQCDLKAGIYQRTAAMVWIYLKALAHEPGNTLLVGAGKVGLETAFYLHHFVPGFSRLDYQDVERKETTFESPLAQVGVAATYQANPEYARYDTLIMATTTSAPFVNEQNISTLQPGTVVISLCTTSPSGEISPEVYGRDDVNVFLDYELTKTFTSDMKKADQMGNLKHAIYLKDLLQGKTSFHKAEKVNLVRLTGTPMQNIAVIEVLIEREQISLG